MFFHFFIYHVDASLATNFSCCLDDLYFSVDPSEAFEIINGFTLQFLPACIERLWLQFIHCCFDESYSISNAVGFPAVHHLKVCVGFNGRSKHLEDLACV
jgi:hypothetical protein